MVTSLGLRVIAGSTPAAYTKPAHIRPVRIVASTSDFLSEDRGSIPLRDAKLSFSSVVEQRSVKPMVASSNLAHSAYCRGELIRRYQVECSPQIGV